MFGGSFSELALIFLVALVVLGPTRLPGLVRTVGRWVGKARMMARDFQQQLESEINLDELNRMTDIQTRAGTPESADANPAAASGYPYGTATPEDNAASAESTEPKPGDDAYSHAHAHAPGEAPAMQEPAASPDPDLKKDDAAA